MADFPDLSETDIIARADNKVAADVGDGTVILDIESGYYFQLNKSGARIWNLFETRMPVAELCAKIEAAFDVDSETCRLEVAEFVGAMREKRLVRIDAA
jgi:hypothetical protein